MGNSSSSFTVNLEMNCRKTGNKIYHLSSNNCTCLCYAEVEEYQSPEITHLFHE